MYNLYIPVCGLFCALLLCICFFSRKRVKSKETKLFSVMLINSLIDSILMVSIILIAYLNPEQVFLIKLLNKLDYLQFLFWVWGLFLYIYYISTKNEEKGDTRYQKALQYTGGTTILGSILILISPVQIMNTGKTMYSYGQSSNILYAFCLIYILFIILAIFSNRKGFASKKYLPFYVFAAFAVVVLLLRIVNPGLVIVTAVLAYCNLVMYFTIENPDIKMLEQLNIEKERAEKANRAKTDFLSNMSHEIRTPLNAIVGFSQALMEEDLPESAKEEIEDILTSSNNLLEIVNGILDISKIEANRLEIINTEYNSHKLMSDIQSLIKGRIGEKPLEFRTYIDASMPPVLYGDYVRIKQIIVNLLTNAVKYTKEGFVEFKVDTVIQEDICRLIISVEDSGIGIKTEDIDKLFRKFERFELEKNITTEGTGLGLAITKSLVELMHGKIVVQSIYGKGSKFTVALDQRIVPKKVEELETAKENTDTFTSYGARVLVVDDNKINLKVASRLLKNYQIVPDLALSGQECLDKVLEGNTYDLILMDDMMPRMTGTATLQNLKKIIGFQTPVVALTANAISGMREKYLANGFQDYLSKPINQNELKQVLQKYLEKKEGTMEEKIEENHSKKDVSYLKENDFDVDHGIELLSDLETYEMTMEDFLEESKTRIPKMQQFKEAKDANNYAILAHAMKSDAKYLGINSLAELSLAHEMAGKENRMDFIEEHYQELMDEVEKNISIMENYLGK